MFSIIDTPFLPVISPCGQDDPPDPGPERGDTSPNHQLHSSQPVHPIQNQFVLSASSGRTEDKSFRVLTGGAGNGRAGAEGDRKSKITGTLKQANVSLPLNLERVAQSTGGAIMIS
jgi:hypothetical protein